MTLESTEERKGTAVHNRDSFERVSVCTRDEVETDSSDLCTCLEVDI